MADIEPGFSSGSSIGPFLGGEEREQLRAIPDQGPGHVNTWWTVRKNQAWEGPLSTPGASGAAQWS